MASDILVVDDETDIRELVAGILEDEGHDTRTAFDSDSALNAIAERRPNLIFLDIWLQGSKLDGLALLDVIKENNPDLPVVMISGHGNIETAVSAIQRGAYDYIEKPFKVDRLILIAERALENLQLKKQVNELQRRVPEMPELIGISSAMSQLRQTISSVAPNNSRVLISGGSGSGKELVARTIHKASNRSDGPFVVLSSAAMTPDRMEKELFGIEKGKIGALEEAHGGTLYLDEIADMPMETQNKILRVLVDQNFLRDGGSARVSVDVRILSSTSKDLESLIAAGQFREDLLHRLAVIPIRVPSLAERREDIPLLVDAFIKQISKQAGIKGCKIADDAMAILQLNDWSGNIRQLRNNIERLMILARDNNSVITVEDLPDDIGEMLPKPPNSSDDHLMALPLREARVVFEREYLTAQVGRFGGNISKTAEFVGMERSALHRKMKALKLN
jgi:two-component system nitrogen regulation response regulator NtrX